MDSSLLATTAIAIGAVTVISIVVRSIVNGLFFLHRLRKNRSAHTLELKVDGQTFKIDVGAIDREDPGKIDRAIKAVQDSRNVAAA